MGFGVAWAHSHCVRFVQWVFDPIFVRSQIFQIIVKTGFDDNELPPKFGCAPGVGLIITRLLSQAAGAHARHSCGNAESPCTLPPPRLASPGSACGSSRRHTVWCLCIRCPLGSTAVLVGDQLECGGGETAVSPSSLARLVCVTATPRRRPGQSVPTASYCRLSLTPPGWTRAFTQAPALLAAALACPATLILRPAGRRVCCRPAC